MRGGGKEEQKEGNEMRRRGAEERIRRNKTDCNDNTV